MPDTGPGADGDRFEVVDRETCFQGYFRLDRVRVRFQLYRGGWSRVVDREVFERGHAACVLLYDPCLDRVVLVEQFRAAAIDAPHGPWLVETVAGIIEPGETPEDVVHREAMEEAGTAIDDLERIGEILVSPGGTSERLVLYWGRVDASKADGIHGVAEEGEDIRVITMTSDEAFAAVVEGRICTTNGVIPLQWLALNRDRIRAAQATAG